MFIAGGTACAASKPYIRNSNDDTSINTEGIRFNTFKGSTSNPVKSPDPRIFQSRKDPSQKIELFNKYELWKYEQILGRWFGTGGSMDFAKVHYPLPDGIKLFADNQPDFVRKEDFQNWLKSAELKLESEADIKAWLEAFTGSKIEKDNAFKNKNSKLEIVRYSCDDAYKDLYYIAEPGNTERKYLLLFEIDRNADLKKSMKNTQIIAGTFKLFTPEEASVDDKKLVTKKSSNIKDRSPEYLASRDKVIDSIKNLDGWWYLETRNYIFTADLQDRKLIDEIQIQIEKCRSVYEKYFELKGPLTKISVVKSFFTRKQYLDYLDDDRASRSIGMWMSSKEELVISPMMYGNRKENREEMIDILYHEGFHQYIFYAGNMVSSSPWFNEGHATFFEGLDFKRRGMEVNVPARRIEEFSRFCGGSLSKGMISNLLHMDYLQFYDNNSVGRNYSGAWALVYFLNKGAPVMGKPEYARIPFKYYEALHDLKNPEKATDEAWKDIDLDTFAADMIKFYDSKKFMKKAEKYDFMKNKDLIKNTPK